jgi:hypothetical protein
MALPATLVPFQLALIAGLRRGQRLRCPVSSVQRLQPGELVSSGAWPLYRYSNRFSGQVLDSARLDELVERWIADLDLAAQLGLVLRRGAEEDGGSDGR